ncbi:MAG: hypothetical protein S4CHLAM45_11600 [Chlamydiales bacterium]|nr:hypothetical protein [Chlamydiales bacterium]MCH9619652.1 hypothetical protein [Chlamydiales bacterium]MCH9623258.1 hypothetical protein [Chlamydiales bacterium]
MKKFFILCALLLLVGVGFYFGTLKRLYQGYRSSKDRSQYYQLGDSNIQDITEKLIADSTIPSDLKQPLIEGKRRIVIFKYLSGSENVAGYLSYLTEGDFPLMLFLRGGNGSFGIPRPNHCFSFLEGYNVVGTLYRGNIYGGVDEWGGEDICDVENLIKFLPQLESVSKVNFQPPYKMMGVSRGAMEMFISLSRSEYVRDTISHAISVSGNVDLNVSMDKRPEMRYLFRKKFKESSGDCFDHWLQSRNPVAHSSQLSKSLKILLVYGLEDNRVFLQEQKNLKKALEGKQIDVELATIPGANHGLDGHFETLESILKDWLKKEKTDGKDCHIR